MFERYLLLSLFFLYLKEVDGEVDGEVWKMFSPTNWATKMAKLSDERTLGLDLGDTNSPVLRPTS